jgi:hypothetical protein
VCSLAEWLPDVAVRTAPAQHVGPGTTQLRLTAYPGGSLCEAEHNPPWGVPSPVGANPFPAAPSQPLAPPAPARPPCRRPLPGGDQTLACPRRPHQRVRAGRIEAQVKTSGRVLEPHRAPGCTAWIWASRGMRSSTADPAAITASGCGTGCGEVVWCGRIASAKRASPARDLGVPHGPGRAGLAEDGAAFQAEACK